MEEGSADSEVAVRLSGLRVIEGCLSVGGCA